MQHPPVVLTDDQRLVCRDAIVKGCERRGWILRAINVRTNHVHLVVTAKVLPERVMGDLKAYATTGLRLAKLVDEAQRVWAHHGSTRMLYTPESVQRACVYTVEEQGTQLGDVPENR